MATATLVVVDTDVVSFLFKNHSLAPTYQTLLAGKSLAISLVSFAEIEYGMNAKNWGRPRRELMQRFTARFTLLLPDRETAVLWSLIKNNSEKKGRPISFPDAWIAASAMQLNVPLATHNAHDYAAIDGLTILTAQPRTAL